MAFPSTNLTQARLREKETAQGSIRRIPMQKCEWHAPKGQSTPGVVGSETKDADNKRTKVGIQTVAEKIPAQDTTLLDYDTETAEADCPL